MCLLVRVLPMFMALPFVPLGPCWHNIVDLQRPTFRPSIRRILPVILPRRHDTFLRTCLSVQFAPTSELHSCLSTGSTIPSKYGVQTLVLCLSQVVCLAPSWQSFARHCCQPKMEVDVGPSADPASDSARVIAGTTRERSLANAEVRTAVHH